MSKDGDTDRRTIGRIHELDLLRGYFIFIILIDHIQRGAIDPSFVITHKLPLDQAAYGYDLFNKKTDGCIKIVMKP